jgi:hypothetical protein
MGWVVRYPDPEGTLTVAGNKASGRYFDDRRDASQFWTDRLDRGEQCLDVLEVHHKASRRTSGREQRAVCETKGPGR